MHHGLECHRLFFLGSAKTHVVAFAVIPTPKLSYSTLPQTLISPAVDRRGESQIVPRYQQHLRIKYRDRTARDREQQPRRWKLQPADMRKYKRCIGKWSYTRKLRRSGGSIVPALRLTCAISSDAGWLAPLAGLSPVNVANRLVARGSRSVILPWTELLDDHALRWRRTRRIRNDRSGPWIIRSALFPPAAIAMGMHRLPAEGACSSYVSCEPKLLETLATLLDLLVKRYAYQTLPGGHLGGRKLATITHSAPTQPPTASRSSKCIETCLQMRKLTTIAGPASFFAEVATGKVLSV